MNAAARFLFWVVIVIGGFLVAVVALIALLVLPDTGRYDRANPEYRYVMSRVLAEKPATIQLHTINGDDWQFLCLLGPYSDPVKVMRAEATRRKLAVTSIDPVPPKSFGIAPVEETESAISFLDRAGRGRTVLVDRIIPMGQRTNCYGRDVEEIALPIE